MPHSHIHAGLAALAVGLFASLSCANAAPQAGLSGLKGEALPVEQAGYRHGYRNYNSYPNDYAYSSNSYQYNNGYAYQGRQSDEIRELRRAFPSTNWPPSDRY